MFHHSRRALCWPVKYVKIYITGRLPCTLYFYCITHKMDDKTVAMITFHSHRIWFNCPVFLNLKSLKPFLSIAQTSYGLRAAHLVRIINKKHKRERGTWNSHQPIIIPAPWLVLILNGSVAERDMSMFRYMYNPWTRSWFCRCVALIVFCSMLCYVYLYVCACTCVTIYQYSPSLVAITTDSCLTLNGQIINII